MTDGNSPIFDGKSLNDILSDVYNISKENRTDIRDMIKNISDLVKTATDASILAPIIAQYLEISVKNDDQLVKIANILQKVIASENKSVSSGNLADFLTDDEREYLLKSATHELQAGSIEIEDNLTKLKETVPVDVSKNKEH